METIADLHIHGKYSRGCSKQLIFENLEKYAKIKGINLLGTGDFTHPKWFNEIKTKLKNDGEGIYRTKTNFPFILQTEYSLVYTQNKKGRRIHLVILAPNLEIVEQINEEMKKIGRVDYDGRPIFNLNCVEFTEKMMNISKDIIIIPAHIWTPWFSLFGSKSGFNSLKECFMEQTKNIHAIETGLSSDPQMNWRIKELDKYSILSFSDSHSFWPYRIGREATIFNIKLSYKNLANAIKKQKNIKETIEVDPNYGKYHLDGHRKCNIKFYPNQSKNNNNICPVCKKPLTIGVLQRIEELANRDEKYIDKNRPKFKTLMPLQEIISNIKNKGILTKTVWQEYYKILKIGKNENDVLLNVSKKELLKQTDEKIADAIILNREQKIIVSSGYDGVYGKPLFTKEEIKKNEEQKIQSIFSKQKTINNF
ncbi:MAG: endonuclease Q family protein [Candidatus Woesearchaeota archaeon]